MLTSNKHSQLQLSKKTIWGLLGDYNADALLKTLVFQVGHYTELCRMLIQRVLVIDIDILNYITVRRSVIVVSARALLRLHSWSRSLNSNIVSGLIRLRSKSGKEVCS